MKVFCNGTTTTEIYTLALHDALPISPSGEEEALARARPAGVRAPRRRVPRKRPRQGAAAVRRALGGDGAVALGRHRPRSEEHTSELQSRQHLVCRLLLENNNHYR